MEKQIITKVVVKDYVSKKCPYITSMELLDRGLIELLKKSDANQEEYKELFLEEKETVSSELKEEGEDEKFFDILSVLRDYPHLKKQLSYFDKHVKKNPAELLIEKYNDDQLVANLSRRYFELRYKGQKCIRCDLDQDEQPIVNMDLLTRVTEDYLKDQTIKLFFEGQIEYGDMRARFDALIRNDDGTFDIYEVKGTNDVFAHKTNHPEIDTRIKKKYLYDLLFQYHIYQKYFKGQIRNVHYVFTNRDYRLKNLSYPVCDEELEQLFVEKGEINLGTGTISLREYFDSDGYVENSRTIVEPLETILEEIRTIAKLSSVSPKKMYACRKGPLCPFMNSCFKDVQDNPNSIFKLTNWGEYGGDWHRTRGLVDDEGIYQISDIVNLETHKFTQLRGKDEDKRSNAYTQILMQKDQIKEKYLIDWKRMETIINEDYLKEGIDYLLFFDFESFQHPIPLVKHLGPWKQVVSQYSLHVCKRNYDLTKHNFDEGVGGGVTHFEYIADPDVMGYENPSIELYQALYNQLVSSGIDPIGDNYRVVVFNQNFEKTRLEEFGKDFGGIADQKLQQFVAKFRDNVVDLLHFFTYGAIYCRDFNGRGSLKVVQPTLANDKDVIAFYKKVHKLPFDLGYSLDYHKGDKCMVYNGGICLDLYKSLIIRSHLGEQNKGTSTKELLDEARAYCKIDTWGTVIIFDVIKNIYEKNLKLDAKIV